MNLAKPIYKKENLDYIREEENGYYTLVAKYHPELRHLVINSTTMKILELCDGNRKEDEIISMMKKKYNEVSYSILTRDVKKTIANFSRLMVLEWSGENPYLFNNELYIEDDYFVKIATEEDTELILSFLEKSPYDNKINYLTPFHKNKT